MSGDHNMYQKDKSYLDFECPRCGHCCKTDLAKVGEVGVWGDDEPVAWRSTSPDGKLSNLFVGTSKEVNWTPIYPAPPKQWVGLTDEEFKFIASKYSLSTQTGLEYFKDELEAKLKEKNHGH